MLAKIPNYESFLKLKQSYIKQIISLCCPPPAPQQPLKKNFFFDSLLSLRE